MKPITFLTLFCIFFFTQIPFLQADHVIGGHLNYTYISPQTYKIKLELYRDCEAQNYNATQGINIASPLCGFVSRTLNRIANSPTDITPGCPTASDFCGISPLGIEKHIYEGIVDFSTITIAGCQAQNVADWRISWNSCCRNSNITNLSSPNSQNVYLYADIDVLNTSSNNSPTFTTDPVFYGCVNESIAYAHSATDSDGDSLVYSLTNCLSASNPISSSSSVNYTGGLSGANPFPNDAVQIDATTGMITFQPTTLDVVSLCVLVEEYRNGVKIGESIRESKFTVQSCMTNMPVLTGLDGVYNGSFETTICAGEPISFSIYSADADSLSDTLTLFWDNGISSANFSIDSSSNTPSATFSWTPTLLDKGRYVFVVGVYDRACPLRNQNSYTYTINVLETPPLELSAIHGICQASDSISLDVKIDNNQNWNTSPLTYNWSPTTGLSDSTIANPIVFPTVLTNYEVTVTYDNGCVSKGMTTIRATYDSLNLNLVNQSVCIGESLGVPSNPNYTIFANGMNQLISDNDPSGVYVDLPVSNVPIEVVSDKSIVEVCFASPHVSAGDLEVFLVAPDGKMTALTTNNGGIMLSGAYSDTICFSMSATTSILTATLPYQGIYKPEGDFQNLKNAPINGLWRLWVRDDNIGFEDSLTYFSMTFSDEISLTYQWSPAVGLSCTDCPNPIFTGITPILYTVTATNEVGCTFVDSMLITPLPKDEIFRTAIVCDSSLAGINTLTLTNQYGCDSLITTTSVFENPPLADFTASHNFLVASVLNNSSNATTYQWDFGDGSPIVTNFEPSHTYDTTGAYTITLIASNDSCGSDTTTFSIFVFAVGTDKIETSNTITLFPNPNEGSFTLQTKNLILGDWEMIIYSVNGALFYQEKLNIRANDFSKNYKIPNLENGVYYIRLSSKNQLITTRMVVIK